MFVCMRVCVYMCICVYVYACVYVYICVCGKSLANKWAPGVLNSILITTLKLAPTNAANKPKIKYQSYESESGLYIIRFSYL